jgi:hypothetical protein
MRGRINELLQIVSLPIPNTIGIVDVARAFKDVPRSVRSQFDDCPISM